ncbi:hypothetical protein [Epilithonimonas sp.]|uniref:hypothetical protein n=1 Tax=Epilithonimonas sp. TaxID=2894511 RepID=UPI00289DBB61|nr:hypothetical protein [Epilithonimonas sp.]
MPIGYINLADEISSKSNDESISNSFYIEAANIYYNRDVFDLALKYSLEAKVLNNIGTPVVYLVIKR